MDGKLLPIPYNTASHYYYRYSWLSVRNVLEWFNVREQYHHTTADYYSSADLHRAVHYHRPTAYIH